MQRARAADYDESAAQLANGAWNMTGELDLRTPIPQTEEFYAALKYRGVETVMLRFNGEYHGTGSKPSNFMRTQLYMMSWFQKHAGATTSAAAGQ